MWAMAFEKLVGPSSTCLYVLETLCPEREGIITLFDNHHEKLGNLFYLDAKSQGQRRDARFPCTTYGIASTAIDLRACTKVVLVEPSYQHKNEEQAICRSARTGQTVIVEAVRYTSTDEEQALADTNNTVARIKELATSWKEKLGTAEDGN